MSNIISAKELLESAQAGNKLRTGERRRVIAFLQTTADTSFNGAELSKIFQVSETAIRQDKRFIKDTLVKQLREEGDIKYVISDIMVDFNKIANELEKGLRATKVGSLLHLKFSEAILDTRLKVVKTFQDLGWYPKNLGTIQEEKWIYKAHVGEDGHVSTQKIKSIKEKTSKSQGETIEVSSREVVENKEEEEDFKYKALSS